MVSQPSREKYLEAARRLFAAYVSWHDGIGFEQAYQRYVISPSEIGEYWVELAERVDREMVAIRMKAVKLRGKNLTA